MASTLLLDEMALTEKVSFQGDSLIVHGLVDLGKYTPEADKHKRRDHALAIGAFLSAGAVKGAVLQKLVLEATILLENAGFHVDCVTTDGATWNRSMWSIFGLSKTENSCQHPVDHTRRLYFASDFPHLMKRLWTRVVNKKRLELPEGLVKLSHYEAVVRLEEKQGIRSAFTLTKDHLNLTTYQRMNVRMAMEFFSHTVGTTMENYKLRGEKEDSQPTINFIGRINAVVEAMNSKKPVEALRPDRDSVHQKVLRDFLSYLSTMDDMAKSKANLIKQKKMDAENLKREKENLPPRQHKERPAPVNKISVGHTDEITTSTYLGLLVTVKTALNLIDYLHDDFNYHYLMTRCLNQDALEHFFGQLRFACGSSDHPDPKMFMEVYRLLTTYSLVKPPRGSNVTGGDLLGSLLKLKDITNADRREELERKIDNILEGGVPFEEYDILNTDMQACEKEIDEHALTYFGGYICRKARKMQPAASCPQCYNSLHAPLARESLEREQLLEKAVIKTTTSTQMHTMLLFDTLDQLCGTELQRIGCAAHEKTLTASVITFYMICRMHFACADANKIFAEKKRRKRDMAKQAKFV
ncbi:LOW QUALITY PROTEIN: Transposable element P transposase [Frankliniella fusca]|uniref:Transposable element P transposase n=1 Tax=Frankliniella fusca TaxID=407009 RepID=A0AAE1GXB5_9NEOP|nr:LOW QUALITY PROTEIN: Transposable element P transposase [Frankliniella fusca]